MLRRILRILLLAAVFFATGRLALLLAIPPGYATAIWPPAGIALAALLVYGDELWPGVLSGHFFVNLAMQAAPFHLVGPDRLAFWKAAVISLGIAAGGTLQALLAAWLVRRVAGGRDALTREGGLLRLAILGGPVGSLTSATLGSAILLSAREISQPMLAITWSTWWVGDTIGAMMFAPPLLLWGLHGAGGWRRALKVTLPMAGLFLLTLVFFVFVSRAEERRIQIEFENISGRLARSIAREFAADEEVLRGLQGLYRSAPRVSRAEFEAYVRDWLERHPGVQAVAWVPVIRAGEREAFEAAARAEGFPEFRIFERGPGGKAPAGSRDVHAVITYVEPLQANRAVLGFDMYSESHRREALDAARDTGQPAITPRVVAPHLPPDVPIVVMVAPVYADTMLPGDVHSRRLALRGYASGMFRIDLLSERAITGIEPRGMRFRVIDQDANDDARVMYTQAGYGEPAVDGRVLRTAVPVAVADAHWLVEFRAPEAVFGRTWAPWGVLAAGLLFTSVLGTFLLSLTGRQEEIEHRVREQTEELRESEARLHHLFDHTGDIIYSCTPDGRFEFVSPSVEALLGYKAAELTGRPVIDILAPSAGDAERRCLHNQIDNRIQASYWESEAHARDGRRVWLGQNTRLIEQEGRVAGLIVVARDIGPQRRRMENLRRSNSLLALQAARDPLTGVANRRRFDEALAEEWARARRSGAPLSLILADIDHFKRYNDTHGHPAGDECLRLVAGSLSDGVRRAGELVARYGGEEFAILLPGTGVDEAVAVAGRVRERVRALAIPLDGEPTGRVTLSLGVATAPNGYQEASALLAAADAALYEAKAAGRDTVRTAGGRGEPAARGGGVDNIHEIQ